MVSTRRTVREPDSNPLQQGASETNVNHARAGLETLTQRRQRWSTLLRTRNYYPVISEVLDEELPKYQRSTLVDATDRVSHIRECALILSSAPLVFSAAVDGDLIRRFRVESELQQEYGRVQDRAHVQPSIYMHLLADEDGVAPTANQYNTIREISLRYLMPETPDNFLAHAIDGISSPTISRLQSYSGYRKYLMTAERLSSARTETLLRFCEGIRNRWLETPLLERDIPFTFPPGECGYSINSHDRLAQHRAHRSSNYIMNLVEDICTYLYRTQQFPQLFRMHQFIIYLIFRPRQAAIAEIFCSGLLQVWTGNGGGFNGYPAGRSVQSASRVGATEWAQHERWVRENSPLTENLERQRQMLAEWTQALESLEVGEEPMDVD